MRKKLLVLNGPNLNLLGAREPEIYGRGTYAQLSALIESYCEKRDISVTIYQTNHEGALVDAIQAATGKYDGIIINPAAYTHTSVAILDALKAANLPSVEVHITNPEKREDFRKISYIRPACFSTIAGLGFEGYLRAIDELTVHWEEEKCEKS